MSGLTEAERESLLEAVAHDIDYIDFAYLPELPEVSAAVERIIAARETALKAQLADVKSRLAWRGGAL